MEQKAAKNSSSPRKAFILAIVGAALTILMAAAVVYYGEFVREEIKAFGYLGAFIISIMGGATIIVPVPMLAVVFALGGVMKHTWLVGIAAGLGEVVGAFIIYMTGYGGGRAFYEGKHGRIQAAYERLEDLMERRGSWTLFILSAVINPFFYPAALAAGAMRFGLKKYFFICLTGKMIKAMTIVYAGYWGLKGIFQMLGVNL